ncbi:MAG TPA: hypothetical protein VFW66_12530, partial [Gemmatimonadales bacterium]|nr:hypothetical protein [Gemmatimonadales bacterium]
LMQFGDFEKGRRALKAALRLAHRHRLHAWYFRIERILSDAADGICRESLFVHPQSDDCARVVEVLELNLRGQVAHAAG